MILSAVKNGLKRSWELKRLSVLFWLFNFIFAVLFVRPFFTAFRSFFSHRLATEVLARQNIYTFYSEFFFYLKPAVTLAKQALLTGGFLFYLVAFLLSGGLLYFFVSRESVGLRTFWVESGRYLGRMLRLSILAAVVTLVTVFIAMSLFPLLKYLLLPDGATEPAIFAVFCIWLLLFLLILLMDIVFIDLSRVFLVRDQLPQVLRAAWRSLTTILQLPGKLLIIFLLIHLFWLALFAGYWWLQSLLPDSTVPGVAANFILLQLFVFLQYWVRFSRFGALAQVTAER